MERFWADTPTLEQRLIAVGRRPSGFDYLRLGLALCVVGWHSVVTCYGAAAQDALYGDPWRPVVALLLPMFFSLSGFLVAASLERCRTLIGFLGLRVLRIGPALAVETILSAVLLGALTTTLPKADYFASPAFWGYFQNIVGRIHYVLPGVLAHNPRP